MRRFAWGLSLVMLTGLVGAQTLPASAETVGVQIHGRVTDGSGRGLRHIRLELHDPAQPDPDFYVHGTLSDENGYYDLPTSLAGTYRLEANDPFYEQEWVRTYFPGVTRPEEAVPLTVEDGQDLTIDFAPPAAHPQRRSTSSLDTSNRAAVTEGYRNRFAPYLGVTAPGLTAEQARTCQFGTETTGTRLGTLAPLNYVRALSQIDPVTFDPAISRDAQEVAGLMYLHGSTANYINPTWRCYTETASGNARGASLSSRTGARAVADYLSEDNDNETRTLVNREPILDPLAATMGSGTVGSYHALYPYGARDADRAAPLFTSWPTSGYFPAQLLPAQRWSFTPNNRSYNLTSSKVTVQRIGDGSGPTMLVTSVAGRYSPAVWIMPSIAPPAANTTATYRITISGMRYRGWPAADHTYDVQLFDARDAPALSTAPVTAGTTQVGSVLSVKPPVWNTAGVLSTYQWLRDGRTIANATKPVYALGASDVGHRMAVIVTGSRVDLRPVAFRTADTNTVTKKPASLRAVVSSPQKGQLTFKITVTATGEPPLSGTVWITEKTAWRKTLSLDRGQASAILTKVSRGSHTYAVTWGGNPRVGPASGRVTASPR